MNNNKVSAGQFFLFMFVIRLTSFFLSYNFIGAGTSLWEDILPFIFFSVLSFFLIFPLVVYHNKCNQCTPLEENCFILISKSLFFSVSAVSQLLLLESFINAFGNDQLNILILVLFFYGAVVYAARAGIESIIRFSALLFVILMVLCITAAIFAFPSFSTDNFPLFSDTSLSLSFNNFLSAASLFTDFAIVFSLSKNIKGEFYRCMGIWNVFSLLTIGFFMILTGGCMGYYLQGMAFPYFHIIDITGELQRFDPIFIGIALSGLFCRTGISLYITINSLREISEKRLSIHRFVPAGISILILGLLLLVRMFDTVQNIITGNIMSVVMLILFTLILPISGLITIKQKKRQAAKCVSAVLLSFCVLSFSCTGCMPVQLNQRIIVQGIGIDKYADQYTATMLVLDSDSKDYEKAVKILTCSGNSIDNMLQNMENQRGKTLLFSQCLFILMNTDAAKEMEYSLDCLADRDDIIKTTQLMVCEDPAADILHIATEEWNYHPEDISMLTNSKATQQNSVHFSLFDFLSIRNQSYNDMFLPLISTNPNMKELQSIKGCIISLQNHQCILLDHEEMLGALLLNGKIAYFEAENSNTHSVIYPESITVTLIPEITGKNTDFSFYIDLNLKPDSSDNLQELVNSYHLKALAAVKTILSQNGNDIFKLFQAYTKQYTKASISPQEWHDMLKTGSYHIYWQ